MTKMINVALHLYLSLGLAIPENTGSGGVLNEIVVNDCLTTLCHNKDDLRHPHPLSRLGTGTTRVRGVTKWPPGQLM